MIIKPEIKEIATNHQGPSCGFYMFKNLVETIPPFFFMEIDIQCKMIIRYEIYRLFKHGIKLDIPIQNFKKKNVENDV